MSSIQGTRNLIAGATISNKSVNQDAFALIENRSLPAVGVVVADGLGSHFGADIASRLAARAIADHLAETRTLSPVDVRCSFHKAWLRLEKYVNDNVDTIPRDLDWKNAFGTTALCALNTPSELVIAYVGNGAAFHLRGNFNTFPSSQLLPWSAMNYLNPHTVPENGKNAMYKLLSPRSSPSEMAPTVVTVAKDDDFFGDIVVCVTDGIYSYDQVPMGLDSEKKIWISGETSIATLLQELSACLEVGPSNDSLQACAEGYLARLRVADLVTDDCTVAMVVTDRAVRYQESRTARRLAAAAAQ